MSRFTKKKKKDTEEKKSLFVANPNESKMRRYSFSVRHVIHGPDKGKEDQVPAGTKPQRWIPFIGYKEVHDQMWLAHRLRESLVDIELNRRSSAEQIILSESPEAAKLHKGIEDLNKEIDDLYDAFAAKNVEAQKACADKALAERIKERKAARAIARHEYWAFIRPLYKEEKIKGLLTANNESAAEARKKAIREAKDAGLYFATATEIEFRVKVGGKQRPVKHAWAGGCQLTVDIKRKADTTSARVPDLDDEGVQKIHPKTKKLQFKYVREIPFGINEARIPNQSVWIHQPMRDEFDETTGKFKKVPASKYGIVHFRIRSDDKGKAVWACLPTYLHREIPDDAQFKRVQLIKSKIGCHERWEVQFTLQREKWHQTAKYTPAESGVVAFAIGWRKINGNIRVACWEGDDGRRGEVNLPEEMVARVHFVHKLQQTADLVLNTMKYAFLEWKSTMPDSAFSEEWKKRMADIGKWRSQYKMIGFVWWWGQHRIEGDEEIYKTMEGERVPDPSKKTGWCYTGGRKQLKHLVDWREFTRRNNIKWRNQFYVHLAIEFASQYKTLVYADIDWAKLGKSEEPEYADEDVNKKNKGFAAGATLRDKLINYIPRATQVDAKGITILCHACGKRMGKPGVSRWVTCKCSEGKQDRAVNAAKNTLKRGEAALSYDASSVVSAGS